MPDLRLIGLQLRVLYRHRNAVRDFLVRLGVKESDVLVEDASRTTYENAVESVKVQPQAPKEIAAR